MKLAAVKPSLVALTLLTSVFSMINGSCLCSSGGKQYVSMMSMVPVDSTEYHFWAVERLGADDDLWPLYKKFRDSNVAKQLPDIEPVLAVVQNSAKASGFDGSVTVLQGNFNSRDLERRLRNEGYVLSVYRDVEIWTPEEAEACVSVALRDHAVLMATADDLKACIDAIKLDEEDSLYQDQAIKWVTERLSDGLIVDVFRAGPEGEESYADLISYGRSYSKAGDDKMRMTALYMFSDGYAAGPAQNQVRDYVAGEGFTDVETEQEGNFIRVTGLISISDLTERMSY